MDRISIVTICFNNLEDLRNTCRSVDMQEEVPFEHVIIDGSSSGEIRNFLEQEPQPVYRKWLCERDKGIADAFNKGIRQSTGDIIWFLNSGDCCYDAQVIGLVHRHFKEQPSLQWINGMYQMERGGRQVIIGKAFEKAKLYRGMRSVGHPTMFVRREVFERRGGFDTTIRYAMDYDFLCRIADEPNGFIARPLAIFDNTGVSNVHYLATVAETQEVFRRYYSQPLLQTLWLWRLTFLHHLLKSPAGKLLYRIKSGLGLANA